MEIQSRKQNRLGYYDYGKVGSYFVTVCTHKRQPFFQMENPAVGNGLCAVPNQIVHRWIAETQSKYKNIIIDKYIIMPDHLHFIVTITERHTDSSLSDAMQFFKTMTTNEYIRGVKQGLLPPFKGKIWQKSYYDHIIRNQQDYNEAWEYIENNPVKWMLSHNLLD